VRYDKVVTVIVASVWALEFFMFAIFTFFSQKHKIIPHGLHEVEVVCYFLFLPAICSLSYFFNCVDAASKGMNIVTDQELKNKITPLIEKSGISGEVIVAKFDSEIKNAFAISSPVPWINKSLIAFSSSLLEVISEDELLAIASHEIGHIVHGDSRGKAFIMSFHNMINCYPRLAANVAKESMKPVIVFVSIIFLIMLPVLALSPSYENIKGLLSGFKPILILLLTGSFFILLSYMITFLLSAQYHKYSRMREYEADAFGARLSSPSSLILALKKISQGDLSITSLFDTHPPLEKRIEKLNNVQLICDQEENPKNKKCSA